ncbi:CAF1 family ribonuclease [Aspergillus novofumigatus IBT 16806]|uniref:Putative CAF1 family ribonuclease n=1 Tax=Aspergillus novofumigatus (strain IBT 16806) TaxID=1392255 RepID=A0A2I1CPN7_ASPN1|nr:putative CAF1 family ribonuclease [Aspergillus novofumigatus IBT 16806]PKX99583.1 putative CAF1 family ribonuclease [Aspergillus novofumigatus IBT 16806]
MDVTAQTFPYHLPRILDDLATCCFVSMDFEFSGIATTSSNPNRGSQTLQARYEEVKNSADKYQILQVGLTICHEDTENASYTLKPYNVNLNPIIDRRLEVERGWSMQSSAIEFLLENKFSIDSVLKQGVQYLSREEEKQAIANAIERRDRVATHTSIDVKETEHESLAFLKAVRRLVDDWLALGATREEYLNIPPPTRLGVSQSSKSLPSALNRFQKRLVHQLIEVEYPSLVTISRPDFIQIIDYNEERERSVREQRVTRVRERAWKQTGFRWVAEALAGGDLTNLDSGYLIGIMASSAAVESKYPLNEFSDKLKQRLKEHRPVLVGHNLFSDLIYFCRCFFGPLPSKVEEFQSMAHELFPVLMDTKYMATHNCGSINPRSSLSELNENLAKKAIPKISIHPQHSKYTTQKIEHEAGYDSLLTAQVFIRLSAQLRGGGVDLPQQKSTKGAQDTSNLQQTYQEVASDAYTEGRLQTTSGSAQKTFEQKPRPSSTGSPKAPTTGVLGTRFDLLEIEEAIDEVNSNIPIDDRRLSLGPTDSVEVMEKAANGELIPRLGAEFWKVYGNKLRVFGTLERVCVMGAS